MATKSSVSAKDDYSRSTSRNWKHWVTQIDLRTCLPCKDMHGKIYHVNERISRRPPLHPNCRCTIEFMQAILAGYATKELQNGADWWLKHYHTLPGYYITEAELIALGWRKGTSPNKYAPGTMPTMGIYRNDDHHLPSAPGRVWHEADINYYSGRRNAQRIVWSNDGLVFITNDHYETFIEIK